MSVIIRLQNLPWNANALDIRRFFQGLSIPDGGVHIIGGEKGDAFIAFSTDEDARQAMISDGGRINGYAVKLLLSSKTEMQNVIAAAKGGPPPPLPTPIAGLTLGQQKLPVAGFYDRPMVAPVGGAPVQFVGANIGGDVTGSGQGLRSSTGLGSLPPAPYGGFPGSIGQVVAQPIAGGTVMAINEPPRVLAPAAPVIQPAARSLYETRPIDRGPVLGSLQQQQPPIAPMDTGLRTGPPAMPAVGAWTSPPPQSFSRPADVPMGYQAPGFSNSFPPPGPGREPVRVDSGRVDAARNGHAYGAPPPDGGRGFPDSGRNFVPAIDPARNLGSLPPVDLGRNTGRVDAGMPAKRPEERREPPRFMGDQAARWPEREVSGSGENRPGNGRPFGSRDVDSDPRREFQRPEADRGYPPPDRWSDNRGRDMDRGPGGGPLARPGPSGPDDRRDRPPMFAARFDSDRSGPGMGRYPEDRPRGDSRADYGRPDTGYREPPPQRSMMDDPMRRLPPPPDQRWMDDRRDFGPPGPRTDGRPVSPPRDRRFPDAGFPPRDDPWRDARPVQGGPWRGEAGESMRGVCIRVENLPQTFNYREVRRFFQSAEIPRGDGIKLINDRSGMRTGLAFIRMQDHHSLRIALDRNGQMADGRMISVRRCPDEEFHAAVDGKPPVRSFDRSRSPHKRTDGEQPNVSYFVVKKIPLKAEKEDVRKFFSKFKIAADGGPFFELAFDKTPTGNALIAIAVGEKDASRVIALKRTALNGALVDIIKIAYHEFAERSRRARQCDEKDAKTTAPSSSSSALKKVDKLEAKPKEPDRGAHAAAEGDGIQVGGGGAGEGDQRVYCIVLRGIPYTASPAMVQDFFKDIEIPAESIHIVYNREHRASGAAFVELNSLASQKKALDKDKQYMGHRFVEIRSIGQKAMVEEFNKQQQKFGGTLLSLPNKPAGDRPKPGGVPVLLSMQNLHYDTQLEDILDFFSGYHPIVDSIKLQYKDGQPTGDGLIEFESRQEAESALRTKNRHMLLGKPITLSWP